MEAKEALAKEKVYGAEGADEARAAGLYERYPLVDPVMFQVVANGLVSTCREMGTTMMRTAYSPIFVDGLDFSCGILDARAEMVAQAEYCPSHLNSMAYAAAWAIMEIGVEHLEPGDVILHNDPYRGGTHLNDFNVMKPVFDDGEFVAIACNRAHQIDVGGRALAGFPGDADEIFQEGVTCPPERWYKGGVEDTDVLDMLLANVRQPYIQVGDFAAQLASCVTAERRLQEFCVRYGSAALLECFEALQDYSERRMRAEIEAMPDGVFQFDDFADDDGITPDPIRVAAQITIAGDEIEIDFSDSSGQVAGPMNATYGITSSGVFNALLQVSDPHIPVNSGALRAMTIVAPRSSVVNAEHPRPTMGGSTDLSIRIIEACMGAFAQAVPDRVIAATYGTTNNFTGGATDPETGFRWLWYFFNEGGWGARSAKDGWNEIFQATGNCNDYPTEILEPKHPITVESLSLSTDREGAGTWRGGYGLTKTYRFHLDAEVNLIGERHRFSPWGLFGGLPADTNAVLYCPAGSDEFVPFDRAFGVASPSKFGNVKTKAGDRFRLVQSGGGGRGNPLARDPENVLRDVEDELVSADRARSVYGVLVEATEEGSGWRLDREATARERSARRDERAPNQVAGGTVTVCDASMAVRGTADPRAYRESRSDRLVNAAREAVDESICRADCPKRGDGHRCPYWSGEALKFWGADTLSEWTRRHCPQSADLLPAFERRRLY